jgi:hypothetical protein
MNCYKKNKIYYYESVTEAINDLGDKMIAFAVSSKKNNLKGIIVNAYGMYSDTTT